MKRNVYQTAAIVTVLSVLERALGFLYRIVLSRFIGAEGLGIYQVALSVFSVFVTVGSGGIPVTVSRLISKSKAEENGKSENAVVTSGILFSLLLTLPVCLFFYPFQNLFSALFSDERSVAVFGILLFGLILTCQYAVIRGKFWGNKKFLLTSTIEILEEGVMVVVGIFLLRSVCDPFVGAKKAAIAVVCSYLVSFSVSLLCFFLHGGKFSSPKKTFQPLLSSALPITAVRTSGSLISSAVAVLIPAMLVKSGYSQAQALAVFGVVSGMAMPVLSVPSTFIGAISLVLVPELSEDYYAKNTTRLTHNVERGLFVSLAVACAITPFFYTLGNDLGRLLYSDALSGEIIARCCFLLLPMSVGMISTGILNSLHFEKQTLCYYFVGAAAMLACILLFSRKLGAYAYPVGLFINFSITVFLNLRLLKRHVRFSKLFLKKNAIAAALTFPLSLIGKFVYLPFSACFSPLLAISLCAVVMIGITFICYLLCGILSFSSVKKIFLRNNAKNNAN